MEDAIDIYHPVIFGWKVQIALDHTEAQGPQPYQKLIRGSGTVSGMCRSRWYQNWVFPSWQLLWTIRKTIKKGRNQQNKQCVHYTTNDLKVLIIYVNASLIRVGNHKQAIEENGCMGFRKRNLQYSSIIFYITGEFCFP